MASVDRPALAQVDNLVPVMKLQQSATQIPSPCSTSYTQVQTGETVPCKQYHMAHQNPSAYRLGKGASNTFSDAMDNCLNTAAVFDDLRRIQQSFKDLKPLLAELKAEKQQVEQERDEQKAAASTLKQQVATLQAHNDKLFAEVVLAEEEMCEGLEIERERADQAQHDRLVAEKALEDSMSVNRQLHAQVLQLRRENEALQQHCLASFHPSSSVASHNLPQTSPWPLPSSIATPVSTPEDGVSIAADDDCSSCATYPPPKISRVEALMARHMSRAVCVNERAGAMLSRNQVAELRAVHENLMKGTLLQIDALQQQHICLQVLLEDSPVPRTISLSPSFISYPVAPASAGPERWNENPVYRDSHDCFTSATASSQPSLRLTATPEAAEPETQHPSATLDSGVTDVQSTRTDVHSGSVGMSLVDSLADGIACAASSSPTGTHSRPAAACGTPSSPDLSLTNQLDFVQAIACTLTPISYALQSQLEFPMESPVLLRGDQEATDSPMGSWAYNVQSFTALRTPHTAVSRTSPAASTRSMFQHKVLSPMRCAAAASALVRQVDSPMVSMNVCLSPLTGHSLSPESMHGVYEHTDEFNELQGRPVAHSRRFEASAESQFRSWPAGATQGARDCCGGAKPRKLTPIPNLAPSITERLMQWRPLERISCPAGVNPCSHTELFRAGAMHGAPQVSAESSQQENRLTLRIGIQHFKSIDSSQFPAAPNKGDSDGVAAANPGNKALVRKRRVVPRLMQGPLKRVVSAFVPHSARQLLHGLKSQPDTTCSLNSNASSSVEMSASPQAPAGSQESWTPSWSDSSHASDDQGDVSSVRPDVPVPDSVLAEKGSELAPSEGSRSPMSFFEGDVAVVRLSQAKAASLEQRLFSTCLWESEERHAGHVSVAGAGTACEAAVLSDELSFEDSSVYDDEDGMHDLSGIQEEGSGAYTGSSSYEDSSEEEQSEDGRACELAPSCMFVHYPSDSEADADFDPAENLQDGSPDSDSGADSSGAESAPVEQQLPRSVGQIRAKVAPVAPVVRELKNTGMLRPACKIVRFSTAGRAVDADEYLRRSRC